MATKSGSICDLCEAQHLTNEAEIWCPQIVVSIWYFVISICYIFFSILLFFYLDLVIGYHKLNNQSYRLASLFSWYALQLSGFSQYQN
jgi:hypothetical protein